METVRQWKEASQSKVDKSLIRKRRQRQLERTIDDDGEFQFIMTRQQTRYKQINYTRYPYTVTVPEDLETMSFDELEEIHEQLAEIGFECNLSQYHSKNQRKFMTQSSGEKSQKGMAIPVRTAANTCPMAWVCTSIILSLSPKAGKRCQATSRYSVRSATVEKAIVIRLNHSSRMLRTL